MKILSLKKRQEFVHASKCGNNAATKGLVLQAFDCNSPEKDTIHIGFTATKRLGNAVIRNRVKRRLRALALDIMPEKASHEYNYVLIGRFSTATRDFSDLQKDLKYALHKTGTHINS